MIVSQLTTGSSETNSNNYSTAVFQPTTGRLVLVAVASVHGSTLPDIPSLSGNNITWTQLRTQTVGTLRRITLFYGLASSPTNTDLDFSFNLQTQERCFWSVTEFEDIITTGTNGIDGIVQNASNSATGTHGGLTVTLSAFNKSTNAAFGVLYAANSFSVTPGSGFTELGENSVATGVIEAQWKKSSDTSVDWSWTSTNTESGAIAVELANTDVPGGGFLFNMI